MREFDFRIEAILIPKTFPQAFVEEGAVLPGREISHFGKRCQVVADDLYSALMVAIFEEMAKNQGFVDMLKNGGRVYVADYTGLYAGADKYELDLVRMR